MNTTPDDPHNPPPVPSPKPRRAIPPPDPRFASEPIAGACHPLAVLESVLKHPGRVLHELRTGRAAAVCVSLALIALVCLGIYGLVAGSLSGGSQLWLAPAKITAGSFLCVLICLPSLYIFLCLSGADVSLRHVAGELLAAMCLMALLLIGFAPVAWVFSQSTDSVALMGFLHLLFWVIALWFGLRLLGKSTTEDRSNARSNLSVWIAIYVVVCLQMMTTLRPIIGKSDHILPAEKKFFLTHMMQVLSEGPQESTPARH